MNLKFRAWHKKAEIMSVGYYEFLGKNIVSIDLQNKTITEQTIYFQQGLPDEKYLDEYYYSEYGEDDSQSEVILMQFTGQLDDNNNEIYEGDIVETTWINIEGKTYRKRGIVEQHISYFGIRYPVDKDTYPTHGLAYSNKPIVIGNIYENKELL